MILIFVLFLFLQISFVQVNSCLAADILPVATDSVSYKLLGKLDGDIIYVRDTINLNNKICELPNEVTIKFKGGIIKNGTLIGNNTKLECTESCLNRVRILGTWNVQEIKSSFFSDLSYDNALKDVVALSDSKVKNKIIIDEGKYYVTAYKNGEVCIPIYDNTEIIINGDIILSPNSFRNYYILRAKGRDIRISGKGAIIGDKQTHLGKDGEWGMGIDLEDAHHTTVTGITVKDCWGDCIYVGSGSTDITISNCNIVNGRRQGISITSANGVRINNCIITDVKGTAPEYAIDIEPNRNETVTNVIIDNVIISKCMGGIMAGCYAENAQIGVVTLTNSSISGEKHFILKFVNCDTAIIENNIVKNIDNKRVLVSKLVKKLVLQNNKLGKNTDFHVITDCNSTVVRNNSGFNYK